MRDTSQVHRSQSASLPRYAIEFGEWMARVGNERARALGGHAKLRPAHNRLIGFIEFEGSRIVDIAQAQAVSKNAIGQLVTDLEELGYLERVPDPADGRAKIVRYTDRGGKKSCSPTPPRSWNNLTRRFVRSSGGKGGWPNCVRRSLRSATTSG